MSILLCESDMGRKPRAEIVEGILYQLAIHDGINESSLLNKVSNFIDRKVPHSTFLGHLKTLETLDFVSLHPSPRGRIAEVIVRPELLLYMYALYRSRVAEKQWILPGGSVEKIMDRICFKITDYYNNYERFTEELIEDSPELGALMKSLGRMIVAIQEKIIKLHEKILFELSEFMFEGCMTKATIRFADSIKEIETINLIEFERRFLNGELWLYRAITEAVINSLGSDKDLEHSCRNLVSII